METYIYCLLEIKGNIIYCLLEIKLMPLVYRGFFFNEMTQYTTAIKNSCLCHALYPRLTSVLTFKLLSPLPEAERMHTKISLI